MTYIFDSSRRLLIDEQGLPVSKLYIKRYDKVALSIKILGKGTSVAFAAAVFEQTGVRTLMSASSVLDANNTATLSPQSNTVDLVALLKNAGQMLREVELQGEFIVFDASSTRIASINIPVVYAASCDNPDIVIDNFARATITASVTQAHSSSAPSVVVTEVPGGYNFAFSLPTQSVDLSQYVKFSDTASPTKAGVVKTGGNITIENGIINAPTPTTGGVASINGLTGSVYLDVVSIYQNGGITKLTLGNSSATAGVLFAGQLTTYQGQTAVMVCNGGSASAVDLSHYQGDINIWDASGKPVLSARGGEIGIGYDVTRANTSIANVFKLYAGNSNIIGTDLFVGISSGGGTSINFTSSIDFFSNGGMKLNNAHIHN